MSQAKTIQENSVSVEDNPILKGNFAPVAAELTAHDLVVEGNIPEALTGMLLRDGPNPMAPSPGHHWFQGNGMIHGINLSGGGAQVYRNR